jgi:hypothetical protein
MTTAEKSPRTAPAHPLPKGNVIGNAATPAAQTGDWRDPAIFGDWSGRSGTQGRASNSGSTNRSRSPAQKNFGPSSASMSPHRFSTAIQQAPLLAVPFAEAYLYPKGRPVRGLAA